MNQPGMDAAPCSMQLTAAIPSFEESCANATQYKNDSGGLAGLAV